MLNLKILCLSFLFAGLYVNCSLAQDKTSNLPITQVKPPSTTTFNTKTEKFESIEGKFIISIPQAPSQTRDLGTEAANKKGIDVGKIFIWQFPEKALYTVMYKNAFDSDGNPLKPGGNPKTQDLRDFEAFNSGTRRGIVGNNAKLLSEKPIPFKNYPGTEFRYMSSDGVKFIGRIYLINSIGYQITGGYKDDEVEKEVLKVLDSFKLLTETNSIKGK